MRTNRMYNKLNSKLKLISNRIIFNKKKKIVKKNVQKNRLKNVKWKALKKKM